MLKFTPISVLKHLLLVFIGEMLRIESFTLGGQTNLMDDRLADATTDCVSRRHLDTRSHTPEHTLSKGTDKLTFTNKNLHTESESLTRKNQ